MQLVKVNAVITLVGNTSKYSCAQLPSGLEYLFLYARVAFKREEIGKSTWAFSTELTAASHFTPMGSNSESLGKVYCRSEHQTNSNKIWTVHTFKKHMLVMLCFLLSLYFMYFLLFWLYALNLLTFQTRYDGHSIFFFPMHSEPCNDWTVTCFLSHSGVSNFLCRRKSLSYFLDTQVKSSACTTSRCAMPYNTALCWSSRQHSPILNLQTNYFKLEICCLWEVRKGHTMSFRN